MSTLQEFLKQRAEHLSASFPEKVKIQNDWIQAVDRLLNQIKQWLKDADPQAILDVFEESVDRRESGVGVYQVHSLRIRLEAQEVRVIPIARNSCPGKVLLSETIAFAAWTKIVRSRPPTWHSGSSTISRSWSCSQCSNHWRLDGATHFVAPTSACRGSTFIGTGRAFGRKK